MLTYKCTHRTASRTQTWNATIKLIAQKENLIEVAITGRGSYLHVITGRQCNGHFICIPNYEVGNELASYDDVFWNRERLRRSLGIIDATTVATGLKHIQELLET